MYTGIFFFLVVDVISLYILLLNIPFQYFEEMALSPSTHHRLLLQLLLYIVVCSCKFGIITIVYCHYHSRTLLYMLGFTYLFIFPDIFFVGMAFDYPHLGAAGVVADQYLPKAEGEGETDRFFPQAGIIGLSPSRIFNKALGCLKPNYVSDCT